MTDKEIIKLMADVGPNAKEALDSWIALQWANFYLVSSFKIIIFFGMAVSVYILIKIVLSEDKKPRRKNDNN